MTDDVLLGAVRLSPDGASKEKEARFYFIDSGLPGIDFNREIIKPGQSDGYPDGALVIRADDDFWIVAVLAPEYQNWALEKIVATLWPEYASDATYTPDADTHERAIYNYEHYAAALLKRTERCEEDNRRLREENERLRAKRPAPRERYSPRAYAANNYFIRQYEALLTSTAHVFEPRPEDHLKGVCVQCGLYGSDRVHAKQWIARRAEGGDNRAKALCEFDDEPDESQAGNFPDNVVDEKDSA